MADEFILGLNDSYNDVEKLNRSLDKTIDLLDQASKKGKGFRLADSVKSAKGFNKDVDESTTKIEAHVHTLRQLASVRNSDARLMKKQASESSKLAKTIQKNSAASKKQLARQTELSRSYNKLIAQKKKMRAALNDLIVSKGRDAAATKRMQSAYDKVDNKIGKANKSFLSFSKGGIRGAVGGLKNLVGAFGLLGAGSILTSLTSNIFKLSKQFDAFNFAMSKTIPNVIELADTQEFLDDITQRFGADLITTTERYIKFDAAARQSNLSMKETQRIFGTVTKAAGVLGLKTDELQGVYLALEQMLSKGKVTTEELRRQLGERLPGAFGIMAEAMGVSTAKLDEMLKKGEILSKDALPKFADALEDAYGIKAVKTVDTLQAAQTRLSNAWAMFVRDISGDDTVIQNTFKGVLSFMSDLLDGIKSISDEIKDAFKDEAVKAFEKQTNEFEKLQKRQIESLDTFKDANIRANEALRQRFEIEEALAKKIQEEAAKRGYSRTLEDTRNQARKLVDEMKNVQNSVEFTEGYFEDANKNTKDFLQDTVATAHARIRGIDAVLKKIEELNEATTESDKKTSRPKNLKSTISIKSEDETDGAGLVRIKQAVDEQIESIKELLEYTPKWSNEYDVLTKRLENLEKAFDGIDVSDANAEIQSNIDKIEKARKEAEKLSNALSDYFKGFQDEFFSEAGLDFTGQFLTDFDQMIEMLESAPDGEKWMGYFNAITEMAQEAFNFINQTQTARFDAQYERLEKDKDIALQFAGEGAAAKERIEQQYEARRKAIQRKQAKAQKESAIANTIINTAQAVVGALAPPPTGAGAIAGIPLGAIIAGIGAAQVALISSTPVPEFRDGVRGFEGGLAVVGDGGVNEYVKTPDGGVFKTPSTDTLVNLPKGSDVFKNEDDFLKDLTKLTDSNGILFDKNVFNLAGLKPSVNIETKGLSVQEMDAMLGKHFGNIKTVNQTFDKAGMHTYISKGHSRTIDLNNRTSFNGISV